MPFIGIFPLLPRHVAAQYRMAKEPSMRTTVKDRIFNHIPPAMIAAVLCFWAFGPKPLLDSPWTLTVVSPLIVVTVLLLEQVHERHAGWRMNRQEFFTDLFYRVQIGRASVRERGCPNV